jgi:hypothetical protein
MPGERTKAPDFPELFGGQGIDLVRQKGSAPLIVQPVNRVTSALYRGNPRKVAARACRTQNTGETTTRAEAVTKITYRRTQGNCLSTFGPPLVCGKRLRNQPLVNQANRPK